jgi:hypothetical protein
MDIKFEKRTGNKSVYTSFIAGRQVRATTVGGEQGARKIFEIISAQNGVSRSPAIAQDLSISPRSR